MNVRENEDEQIFINGPLPFDPNDLAKITFEAEGNIVFASKTAELARMRTVGRGDNILWLAFERRTSTGEYERAATCWSTFSGRTDRPVTMSRFRDVRVD